MIWIFLSLEFPSLSEVAETVSELPFLLLGLNEVSGFLAGFQLWAMLVGEEMEREALERMLMKRDPSRDLWSLQRVEAALTRSFWWLTLLLLALGNSSRISSMLPW